MALSRKHLKSLGIIGISKCTKEEYENAPEYNRVPIETDDYYLYNKVPSNEEINTYLNLQTAINIRTIKRIMIFFTVASVSLAIIYVFVILSKGY